MSQAESLSLLQSSAQVAAAKLSACSEVIHKNTQSIFYRPRCGAPPRRRRVRLCAASPVGSFVELTHFVHPDPSAPGSVHQKPKLVLISYWRITTPEAFHGDLLWWLAILIAKYNCLEPFISYRWKVLFQFVDHLI